MHKLKWLCCQSSTAENESGFPEISNSSNLPSRNSRTRSTLPSPSTVGHSSASNSVIVGYPITRVEPPEELRDSIHSNSLCSLQDEFRIHDASSRIRSDNEFVEPEDTPLASCSGEMIPDCDTFLSSGIRYDSTQQTGIVMESIKSLGGSRKIFPLQIMTPEAASLGNSAPHDLDKDMEHVMPNCDLSPSSDGEGRHCSRKLIPLNSLLSKKTCNDLLTPEILEDRETLASLGFGYLPGRSAPYPPLPLGVALRYYMNDDECCYTDQGDLEVYEMYSNPTSPLSSSCSASYETAEEETALLCATIALPPVNESRIERGRSESWMDSEEPVELSGVQDLLNVGSTAAVHDGEDASDFACIRIALTALGISFDPAGLSTIPVVRHRTEESVVEFVLNRTVAGLTPSELISTAIAISSGQIFGKFIETHPRPDVSLDKFLAFWIRKGAVPVLCLNLARGSKAFLVADRSCKNTWQYRTVFRVDHERISLMYPPCTTIVEDLWEKLDSPRTQTVPARQVIYLDGYSGPPRREMGNFNDLRHIDDDLNVLGQVAYLKEIERTNRPHLPADYPFLQNDARGRIPMVSQLESVVLPTRMESGIILFAHSGSARLCRLLNNMEIPLQDP